uniref:Uncharacterized protein n=1 Tax=Arundo donax TaxID=35708 RepID=A0A0A9H0Q7_ARUDO
MRPPPSPFPAHDGHVRLTSPSPAAEVKSAAQPPQQASAPPRITDPSANRFLYSLSIQIRPVLEAAALIAAPVLQCTTVVPTWSSTTATPFGQSVHPTLRLHAPATVVKMECTPLSVLPVAALPALGISHRQEEE